MDPTKTWRERAIERYEEYADVHSEKNFTALMRALAVAETTIAEERERLLYQVGAIIMEEHYSDRKERLLALKELN